MGSVTPSTRRCLWFEEEIDENLRWIYTVTKILHTGVSEYQDITLLQTRAFGKVLLLDGKLQSAENDEFVYHEALVHPALLSHPNPQSVFIMGGGEGSTVREALRHKTVEKVAMCDLDEEVVKFCRKFLSVNREAFRSNRLELVIRDARAELEDREEMFDIIIGDLADPIEGGPCYELYTKSFYEGVLKPRLKVGGIFVTQAGPAGVLSHQEVFLSIYKKLKQVFNYVLPYAAHIPSYSDTWGWIMASDKPFPRFAAKEIDLRIKQQLNSELCFLDGETLVGLAALNKKIRQALETTGESKREE